MVDSGTPKRKRRRRGSTDEVEPLFAEVLLPTKRFIEHEAKLKRTTLCQCIDELVQELQARRQTEPAR